MKKASLNLLTALSMLLFAHSPALADETIADALKTNPEVSSFYKLLSDTGVLAEIQGDNRYMVFAPVNSQFEKAVPDADKCLASEACKKQLADLMRNHIVSGQVMLLDAVKYKAGIFAVNNHFIPFTNAGAARMTVEGQNILEKTKYDNGTLYITDGALISSVEKSNLEASLHTAEPQVQKTSTTKATTIPDPACGASGCPNTKTTVTTIRKTITEIEQ